MTKRYQVFISSTFTDLKDERIEVLQTLMTMNVIPAGMEYFSATGMTSEEYIKTVIDVSDFYILIIAGRYGSVTDQNISYTELEYDYAIEKNITVIAFLHEDPDSLSVKRTESAPKLKKRLSEFREKVQKKHNIQQWNTPTDLATKISTSLYHAFMMYKAVGWVRGDTRSSIESLAELNTVRKENVELKERLHVLENKAPIVIPDIAEMSEEFELFGTLDSYNGFGGHNYSDWTHKLTWNKIFALLSPYVENSPSNLN